MSEAPAHVRRVLAVSGDAGVELGQDGVLLVHAGPVTLLLKRALCEEIATTLARAMVRLAKAQPPRPALSLVFDEARDLSV
ncbi:MAG: hypothetical protein OXU20_34960 [Myxococcales bacterium]|nr:hypothetical protein [Myxococcales bacterium]MDD9966133.1 hypothetical protein [Myxococcales bacterium]